MKKCPYCTAEIPDEAVKCKSCGEWVEEPPAGRARDATDPSLDRAVNRWVNLQILGVILGCGVIPIILLGMIAAFFFFVLRGRM